MEVCVCLAVGCGWTAGGPAAWRVGEGQGVCDGGWGLGTCVLCGWPGRVVEAWPCNRKYLYSPESVSRSVAAHWVQRLTIEEPTMIC